MTIQRKLIIVGVILLLIEWLIAPSSKWGIYPLFGIAGSLFFILLAQVWGVLFRQNSLSENKGD